MRSNFNPRAPYGARREKLSVLLGKVLFQSTRPIRGATFNDVAEGLAATQFQSTRPIRGATVSPKATVDITKHFNPRAPYGARQKDAVPNHGLIMISIHAPHTGRDNRLPPLRSQ